MTKQMQQLHPKEDCSWWASVAAINSNLMFHKLEAKQVGVRSTKMP